MKNELDFENIGKKIPYSVPDGFFDDITRVTLEKARQRERKSKIRKTIVLLSAVASVMILVTIGFLKLPFKNNSTEPAVVQAFTEEKILNELQPEEIFKPDPVEIQIDAEPEVNPVEQAQVNSIESLIAEMNEEELLQLETMVNEDLFLDEIIND